jgi:hypothetical protein
MQKPIQGIFRGSLKLTMPTLEPSLVTKLDFYPGLQEKLPASGFSIHTLEQNK